MKKLLIFSSVSLTLSVFFVSLSYGQSSDAETLPTGAAKPSQSDLHVGDYYQGGVIYWLDPSSSPSDLHGLIVDIADQPGKYKFSLDDTETDARLDGAYQGQNLGTFNTAKILATPDSIYPAAKVCAESENQGYSDWYLPSRTELALLYPVIDVVDKTAQQHGGAPLLQDATPCINRIYCFDAAYWTSTEYAPGSVWYLHSDVDDQFSFDKRAKLNVRCIRLF